MSLKTVQANEHVVSAKGYDGMSEDELISFIERINEATKSENRFPYTAYEVIPLMLTKTKSVGLFGKEVFVVKRKKYEYGIDVSDIVVTNFVGNAVLKAWKEKADAKARGLFYKRYQDLETEKEKKDLIQAEIDRIHERVNSGKVVGNENTPFYRGYQSEKLKEPAIFDEPGLTEFTVYKTLDGAAAYRLEKELENILIPAEKEWTIPLTVKSRLLFLKYSPLWDQIEALSEVEINGKHTGKRDSKTALILADITGFEVKNFPPLLSWLDWNKKPRPGKNDPYTIESVDNALKELEKYGETPEVKLLRAIFSEVEIEQSKKFSTNRKTNR
jgi:hypothetical protein